MVGVFSHSYVLLRSPLLLFGPRLVSVRGEARGVQGPSTPSQGSRPVERRRVLCDARDKKGRGREGKGGTFRIEKVGIKFSCSGSPVMLSSLVNGAVNCCLWLLGE